MSTLLVITSRVFGDESKSAQIAAEFVGACRHTHPGTAVVKRDLTQATMPHLSLDALGALMTPAEQRSPEQTATVAFGDRLIEELETADTIVLAAPMYNLSVPSTLKAWIDDVARAGRTFRYTAVGSEGPLKGRKVIIVTTRDGFYSGDGPAKALDFQEPYLRSVLGFLGLGDVTFIHVEGLKVSPEAAKQGIAKAREAITAIAGSHGGMTIAAVRV